MLFTILILLILAVVLAVVLWAGALWLQGWLYESPGEGLYWRAPALAAGLALFYGLWAAVDCRTAGHCGSVYKVSLSTLKQYDELKAVVKKNGQPETYRRVNKAERGADYMVVGPDGQLGTTKLTETPEKILITDGGVTSEFNPERDAKGNFKRDPGQNLRYYDKGGRYIEEGNPGQVQQFRWDWLLWNVFFHILHLGLWFAGLWLVLRFQWSHALGLAICIWLAMTLIAVPMLLNYVEAAFQVVK